MKFINSAKHKLLEVCNKLNHPIITNAGHKQQIEDRIQGVIIIVLCFVIVFVSSCLLYLK